MADIVETVIEAGRFTTLATALRVAGLVDALRGPGPFTVLAPTDEAFDKLSPGLLTNLLDTPSQLRELMLYHVLSGRISSTDIKTQHITSSRTLQGDSVMIDTSVLGRIHVDAATVTRADILTDNGIIHVIDQVILPSAMRGRKAA